MFVKDLICNDDFDCNCNYDIYDESNEKLHDDGAKLIFQYKERWIHKAIR